MENLFELIDRQIVVTAEIGINHNGDLDLAQEMIDSAARCGVDAVKFQCFKTEFMYSRRTPGFSHTEADVFTQIQKLELKDQWWPILKKRAARHNLLFSCSIFDQPSLEIMKKTGLDFLKIASAEIDNRQFLACQKSLSDTYVISTGTATLAEIAKTVQFLKDSGIPKIILLECTSSYPAPPESIHLMNIDFLRDTFHVPVGFSDHTLGIHHAVAASARGARFIEKHFTLDKNMEGPDQKISSDPQETTQLVLAIRDIQKSLKSNYKMTPVSHENGSREIGRKSLIAFKKIKKGQIITVDNTIIKRPGKGIPPNEVRFAYGRTAKLDIEPDQWITWEMVN